MDFHVPNQFDKILRVFLVAKLPLALSFACSQGRLIVRFFLLIYFSSIITSHSVSAQEAPKTELLLVISDYDIPVGSVGYNLQTIGLQFQTHLDDYWRLDFDIGAVLVQADFQNSAGAGVLGIHTAGMYLAHKVFSSTGNSEVWVSAGYSIAEGRVTGFGSGIGGGMAYGPTLGAAIDWEFLNNIPMTLGYRYNSYGNELVPQLYLALPIVSF